MRKGNSKLPRARTGSSVAPLVIRSTGDIGKDSMTHEGDNAGAPATNPTDATLRTVVDLFKRLGKKKTNTDSHSDEEEQAMNETVAMVMDRVMLVVFTVLVLIMYAALFGRVSS